MMGLSKSSLEVFKSCPRCFWLEKNGKLKRPEGIKASIMDGIDDAMKRVAEHAVVNNVAAHYLREVEGAKPYANRAHLQKMMSWRTFQTTVGIGGDRSALIWGQLDDLIQWPDGRVSPWDFKSNGKERDWAEYTAKYNLLQADMYDLLLPAQGLVTTGEAFFTYSWPVVLEGFMGWEYKTVRVGAEPQRAIKVIEAAVDCLEGDEPASNPGCEYCTYVAKRAYREPKGKVRV